VLKKVRWKTELNKVGLRPDADPDTLPGDIESMAVFRDW